MKEYKSILLIKVPYCTHPDAVSKDDDFRNKSTFRPIPSLALAALCSFFNQHKSNDYSLKAVDLNIEAYIAPEISIDILIYPKLLTDCIKNSSYNVLAISAMFVFNVRWVEMAVKLSRKYHPDAKIIVGGGYPTIFPERALRDHDIDDVVIGEGEIAMLHIINKYNNYSDPEFDNKFPFEGYATRDQNGEIKVFQRMHSFLSGEELPIANWDYLNIDKYIKNSGVNLLPIEGGRGCPYLCTYCSTKFAWGNKMRLKPVDKMLRECRDIVDKYENLGLSFVDDNLSVVKKWFKSLLKRLIDEKLTRNVTASNFSVKDIDIEMLDLLAEAGFETLSVGVETGSEEMQKVLQKKLDFDLVRRIVKLIKSKGFYVHILWMVGFPNETLEQINKTFAFARELKGHTNQFSIVLPYPGTKLFEQTKAQGLLLVDDRDLDNFDYRKCDYIKSDEWDYQMLQDMIYDALIEMNFLNNPLLETSQCRNVLLENTKRLLLWLPEHVIANILIGYIYMIHKNATESERHYNVAIDLLKDKNISNTFSKYLSMDHPIIKDFNHYKLSRTIQGTIN